MKLSNVLFAIILLASFVAGICFSYPIRTWASASWDSHAIAGGINGTTGVPIKVTADGTLCIQTS